MSEPVRVLKTAAAPEWRVPAPRGRRRSSQGWTGSLFILPSAALFAAFYLYPLGYALVLSFQHWTPFGVVTWVGWQNYTRTVHDPIFLTTMRNVVIYAVYTIPVGLVWAVGTALAVTHVRGHGLWRTLLFLPSVVSTTSVAILWAWLLDPSIGLLHHLADTGNILGNPGTAMIGLAITVVWANTGYWMVIFLAGLLNVPKEMYEAARVDGASTWRTFWGITLPLLSPTIFYYVTIALSTVWFLFARDYVLTGGGPGSATLMPSLYIYQQAFQYLNIGAASAASWLVSGVAFVLIGVNFACARWWVHYD